MHLDEIARLHKAVKNMKMKAKTIDIKSSEATIRQTKNTLATVISDSDEAFTTLEH